MVAIEGAQNIPTSSLYGAGNHATSKPANYRTHEGRQFITNSSKIANELPVVDALAKAKSTR